ncbi:MAG: HTH domain-containing protein [Candidatus Lokiarchaeia archaeon]
MKCLTSIVKFLLENREISPPELAEEMDLDRVIAWKYLNKLYKKGLLEKDYLGKTTYFTLREPGQTATRFVFIGWFFYE